MASVLRIVSFRRTTVLLLLLLCLMIPVARAGPLTVAPFTTGPSTSLMEAFPTTQGLEINSAGEAAELRNELFELTDPDAEELSAEEASALNALSLLGESFHTEDPNVKFGSDALPKELFPDIPEQQLAHREVVVPATPPVGEHYTTTTTRSMADFFQEASHRWRQGSNAWAESVSTSARPTGGGNSRRSTMLVQMLSGYRGGGLPQEPAVVPGQKSSFGGVNLLKKGRLIGADEL